MRFLAFASTALVLGLFTFGCSTAAPAAATTSNDLVAPSCETVQHVPYATDAQLDAAIATFRGQNPGTWKINRMNDMDGILAAVRFASRTDRPAATSVPAGAEALARAFMDKNRGLLHFTASGAAATDFHLAPFEAPNAVSLTYSGVRAGTEAFGQSVFDIIHLTLWFGDDASVIQMRSWSSTNPDLTLCLQAPAAPIVDAIIGTDLVFHPVEFLPVTPPTPVGKVVAGDIGDAEPIIFGRLLDTEEQLAVAWRVKVTRGGHHWSFVVDAATGEVYDVQQEF